VSDEDLCNADVVHIAAVKAAMSALPNQRVVARVADLLGLLGNPTRLNILLALHSRRANTNTELCVCDLSIVARASKSMTSHQLRLLRTSGLVRQRRAGKMMYYRLSDGPVSPALDELLSLAAEGLSGVGREESTRRTASAVR
jgi:ArsR family transcriptional regulator, lead/cadmium/zinc/bismuth-responsive transcriptional repressor